MLDDRPFLISASAGRRFTKTHPPSHHIPPLQLCNQVVPSPFSLLPGLARHCPASFSAQDPLTSGPPLAHLAHLKPSLYFLQSPPFVRNMSNVSPSAMLLWSVLCCIELVFLLVHLWRYDRLQVSHPPLSEIRHGRSSPVQCLRWNSGQNPGAFKRVMTYGYLMAIPCIGAPSSTVTHHCLTIFRRFLRYGHGQDQVRRRLCRSPGARSRCNSKASPVLVESKQKLDPSHDFGLCYGLVL